MDISGKITIAETDTPQRLPDTPVNGPVLITAAWTNENQITIGNASGSISHDTGAILPGSSSITFTWITNLNQLFIIGAAGQSITWILLSL